MSTWVALVGDLVHGWSPPRGGSGMQLLLQAPEPTPTPGSGVTNPMNGVRPDLNVLGTAFNSIWTRVLGALWAALIAIAGIYVGAGMLTLAQAKRMGNSHMMSDATQDVRLRVVGLAGVVGLPVIITAIITLVS